LNPLEINITLIVPRLTSRILAQKINNGSAIQTKKSDTKKNHKKPL